ncbi:MAG: M36 family metallopeptidase [Nocardioidaceae bacterium]
MSVVGALLIQPSSSADTSSTQARPRHAEPHQRTPGYLDARQLGTRAVLKADRATARALTPSARSYLRSLGDQATLSIDPLTRTVRNLGRTDGFLSRPAAGSAAAVALRYVRDHRSLLGLTARDLSTLTLRRDYRDALGIHHLSWTQRVDGVTVFGNGLRVNVDGRGRIISVQGSPVSGLPGLAADAPRATSTAAAARTLAARDVGGKVDASATARTKAGETVWSNHDYAKRVWFLTPQGLRPGWSTYVRAGAGLSYQHVLDAANGTVLFRRSTVNQADGDAYVYDYYPGAARGGDARTVNLIARGWLTKRATFLNGSSVIAWSDVNDDNQLQASEKTPVPGTERGAQFALQRFGKRASGFCTDYICTWNPHKVRSWHENRKADVTQAFYLASNFHDYLAKRPIAFTPAAGNFQASGGDPVLLNALDGAATNGGMPDGNHIDNANMDTPPDGTPPTMQMYLWHFPGADDATDPWVPTSSAFDASVEYHEYIHGLSNRLVIDAAGNSTLNSIEAGSMGEAWSDYYAMDYLVMKGFVKDTARSGQVFEGIYLTAGAPFRTMAIDCAVGATAAGCAQPVIGGQGGYTYGDFPAIGGGPEVHSSGEVWAQTLWDIRSAFGHRVADTLITRAMSLSSDDPSMLDMRNAILQADTVAYGQSHAKALWRLFAHRGMGYFAGAIDGNDAYPAEDFSMPPAPTTPRTSISGTVTDSITGQPVAGAVVQVAGFGDQFTDVTDADGNYEIDGLYAGTYAKVVVSGAGYIPVDQPVTTNGSPTVDYELVRDWAAASGGAEVADFTGPDYSPVCGPPQAIDTSLTTGWGSTTGDDDGTPTNVFVPKYIVIDMNTAVDIDSFGIDPTATCGDGGSASTGDYRIETSPDGSTWTTAAQGTFTVDDRGRVNEVAPTAGGDGVRYVKFWILSNQTPDFATNCPDGPYSGCSYSDLTEIEVFGTPAT